MLEGRMQDTLSGSHSRSVSIRGRPQLQPCDYPSVVPIISFFRCAGHSLAVAIEANALFSSCELVSKKKLPSTAHFEFLRVLFSVQSHRAAAIEALSRSEGVQQLRSLSRDAVRGILEEAFRAADERNSGSLERSEVTCINFRREDMRPSFLREGHVRQRRNIPFRAADESSIGGMGR